MCIVKEFIIFPIVSENIMCPSWLNNNFFESSQGFVILSKLHKNKSIIEVTLQFLGVFISNHLKIQSCLIEKPKFEHDSSMVESTKKMIRSNSQSLLQRFYGICYLISHSLFGCLLEIEIRSLSCKIWCSTNWQYSNFLTNRVKILFTLLWISMLKSSNQWL
jgi:hypothetical protein